MSQERETRIQHEGLDLSLADRSMTITSFLQSDTAEMLTLRPSSSHKPLSADEVRYFGRYRVEKLIGRGGFGEVYLAIDEQLSRQVAIKVTYAMHTHGVDDQDYMKEARLVAGLDHEHIVPVYDAGKTENGDYFVVSKLIDGVDLAVKLKSERPSFQVAANWIAQIAEALHHAHQKGLVHRDIKPANILIDSRNRAYLTDFGIAIRHDSLEASPLDTSGTPAYMSPEQARGGGQRFDFRSDIYSLGVVLFEMLCGRRPFENSNPMDLLLIIAESEPPSVREFNNSMATVVDKFLAKAMASQPSDRHGSALEFAEELRKLKQRRHFNFLVPELLGRQLTQADIFALGALTIGSIAFVCLCCSALPIRLAFT